MAESATFSSEIAGRYATALFEIARDAGKLPETEAELEALAEALRISADLRALVDSPVLSREEQGAAIKAIAAHMKLGTSVTNTLQVLAANRRLFALSGVIRAVQALAAEARGETSAEVTSAKALSKAQATDLARALKAATGKEVNIKATVDESLIGGLVIKVGSRMIDSSIRAKLNRMHNVMKEVG